MTPRHLREPSGQASIELVAVLPLLLVLGLIAAQVAIVGYGAWSAANSARTGARAEAVGGDPRAAALSAVPAPLREGIRVRDDGDVGVALRVPGLLPGLDGVRVHAAAALLPEAAGDG